MLQRNAYFDYPDIDPVHDKVMGRLLLARSAENARDLEDALACVESTFDVVGFNGTSPHFAHCMCECTRLRARLGSILQEDVTVNPDALASPVMRENDRSEDVLHMPVA